jgi:isoleucyl-tRNA synthetase
MKAVLEAAKAGAWKKLPDGAVEVAGTRIEKDEYELRFRATEGIDAASFAGNAGVVALDTFVDEALAREGLARDFIRLVQVARKEAGFAISDRIHIEVKAGADTEAAIRAHQDMVKAETLALSVDFVPVPSGTVSTPSLQDEKVTLGVRVAEKAKA